MPVKISSGVSRNPPAHAEHAREEADRPAHAQKKEHVDGEFGDRKIELHWRRPLEFFLR
jgi:hypothetical protein